MTHYRKIDTAVDKPQPGDEFCAEGFDQWFKLDFSRVGLMAVLWLEDYQYRRPVTKEGK